MTRPDSDPLWVDDDAGPVVRPYAMTRGRARPKNGFNVITLVTATLAMPPLGLGLVPEHGQIIQLCQQPLAVAEVAAHLRLPLNTVRVLLDDLVERHLVQVSEPRPPATLPDDSVFEALINGLRTL